MTVVSTPKLTKKAKEAIIEDIRLELDEGQALIFVSPKENYWVILASPIKGHIDGSVINFTESLAGLLGRRFDGHFLKGLKYDSPIMMAQELQDKLGFSEKFTVQTI